MKKLIVGTCVLGLLQASARADTGYYLVTTYPNAGQAVLDYQYWRAKSRGRAAVSSPEIGLGYGVSSRWYTELSVVSFRNAAGSRFSGMVWQNDYLLTQGQYSFDLALHTSVDHKRDRARGTGVEFGPVFQTELGRTQFNANLFFQRDYRAEAASPMELVYQWQIKYRFKGALQAGVQGFGEVGKWDDWNGSKRRSFRAGPAVFGAWEVAEGRAIKFEAAWLTGTNATRKTRSLTLRAQYQF